MLEIKDGGLYENGTPIRIFSGTIHYFRVPRQYWKDRLLKLRAAGFQAVETYVCWNLHEPEPGQFDFSGNLDLCGFLEEAQALGLGVILRPSPYICAEWDFGGLPAWLLRDPDLQLRTSDVKFLQAVRRYYSVLIPKIVPYLETHGGPIWMVQVENEYGSYGNDKAYLTAIRDLLVEFGVDGLLCTSDGPCADMLSGGTLDGCLTTLNFGSRATQAFTILEPGQPKFCMEFWCGWFDHWGKAHHGQDAEAYGREIQELLDTGASFNLYVFHGGTNFGFGAGANHGQGYEPTVTSYDYGGALNEWGGYTPFYHILREKLWKARGETPLPLPPEPELQEIGPVLLTERGSLFGNLDGMATETHSPSPMPMEYYGQNHGLIYYEVTLPGNSDGGWLTLEGMKDLAWVYLNDRLVAHFDRTQRKRGSLFDGFRHWMPKMSKGDRIGVLVEAMGRVNYGPKMGERKGLTGLRLGNQRLFDCRVFDIPLDDVSKLVEGPLEPGRPNFFRGHFHTDSSKDTFLALPEFHKGYAYVNGFLLGRYWDRGPQKTLYVPGTLLRTQGENEIVLVELQECDGKTVILTEKPELDGPVPKGKRYRFSWNKMDK